jgi:hypothetical protein
MAFFSAFLMLERASMLLPSRADLTGVIDILVLFRLFGRLLLPMRLKSTMGARTVVPHRWSLNDDQESNQNFVSSCGGVA